jgi:hypothetical protein
VKVKMSKFPGIKGEKGTLLGSISMAVT